MVTLAEKKRELTTLFTDISDTPALDADCIICHVTKKSTAQCITSSNQTVSPSDVNAIDILANERANGKPIAYLLGEKAFWTLDLIVTPDTLIPRPETECLVDWVLTHFKNSEGLKIADLGTGSGAIALALATENPHWTIHATDLSEPALMIAKQNAKKYKLNNVSFFQGAWCQALPEKNYDIIISNPPYITENDPHLEMLSFEPITALTAGVSGLDDIEKITAQAATYLKKNGALVIEHGYDQAVAVCELFQKEGYHDIISHHDLSNLPRFVTGVK